MTEPIPVVIVSYGTRDSLLRAVGSVPREEGGRRFVPVVVDNASPDGSADAVAAAYPDAAVLRNPRNEGFAAAANQGMAWGRGTVCILLNPDAELQPGVATALAAFLESNPQTGIVGASLVFPGGRPQRSAEPFPALWTSLGPKARTRLYATPAAPGVRAREVDSVIGACLAVSPEALQRVGGLDEAYFLFLEETDWCLRMHDAGFRVVTLEGAEVVHHQGEAAARHPFRSRVEYQMSLQRFLRRHRGGGALFLFRLLRPAALAVGTLANAIVVALSLGLWGRVRRRCAQQACLLAWYLLGCPASWGLAPPDRRGIGPARFGPLAPSVERS